MHRKVASPPSANSPVLAPPQPMALDQPLSLRALAQYAQLSIRTRRKALKDPIHPLPSASEAETFVAGARGEAGRLVEVFWAAERLQTVAKRRVMTVTSHNPKDNTLNRYASCWGFRNR